jgi:hypothetical protein
MGLIIWVFFRESCSTAKELPPFSYTRNHIWDFLEARLTFAETNFVAVSRKLFREKSTVP